MTKPATDEMVAAASDHMLGLFRDILANPPTGRNATEEFNLSWNDMRAIIARLDAAEQRASSDVKGLRGALQQIIDMNVQYAIDRYGDATQAETMSCVVVARRALQNGGGDGVR